VPKLFVVYKFFSHRFLHKQTIQKASNSQEELTVLYFSFRNDF